MKMEARDAETSSAEAAILGGGSIPHHSEKE
jgi:hypothetical protein